MPSGSESADTSSYGVLLFLDPVPTPKTERKVIISRLYSDMKAKPWAAGEHSVSISTPTYKNTTT